MFRTSMQHAEAKPQPADAKGNQCGERTPRLMAADDTVWLTWDWGRLKYAIRHAERDDVWGGTKAGELTRARAMAGLGDLPEPVYYEPVRPPIEEVPLEEWDTWKQAS